MFSDREGPSIGCINCALCIDACDGVMAKLNRPRGLIDYLGLDDEKHERAGGAARPILKTLLRPRTLAYFAVWASIGFFMLFTLGNRSRLAVDTAQDRNPVVVTLSDGQVRKAELVRSVKQELRCALCRGCSGMSLSVRLAGVYVRIYAHSYICVSVKRT